MMLTTLWKKMIVGGIVLMLAGSIPVEAQEVSPLAADLVEDGQPIDLTSARYKALFKELKLEHGFTQQELNNIFTDVTILKKPLELMDKQWEARPYYEYFPRLINDEMVVEGKKRLQVYEQLLDQVEQKFRVEREIVVAIWGIETQYGKNAGDYNVFQTLNTLFDAYERRRNFFRKQLIHFLILCKENKIDPLTIKGSYAGAIGQTQFIPSSFREYAVDFDGDGIIDIWNSVPDVVASIANYLHRFHWEFGDPIYWELGNELKDKSLQVAYNNGRRWFVPWERVKEIQGVELPAGSNTKEIAVIGLELKNGGMRYVAAYPNFNAITKWNNSSRYAMAVSELAERFAK